MYRACGDGCVDLRCSAVGTGRGEGSRGAHEDRESSGHASGHGLAAADAKKAEARSVTVEASVVRNRSGIAVRNGHRSASVSHLLIDFPGDDHVVVGPPTGRLVRSPGQKTSDWGSVIVRAGVADGRTL